MKSRQKVGILLCILLIVVLAGIGYLFVRDNNSAGSKGDEDKQLTAANFFSSESDEPCEPDNIAILEGSLSDYSIVEQVNVLEGTATCFRVDSNFDRSIEYLERALKVASDNMLEDRAELIMTQIEDDNETKEFIRVSEEVINDTNLEGEGSGIL